MKTEIKELTKNMEMLQAVIDTTDMAMHSIDILTHDTDLVDGTIKDLIIKQYHEYKAINTEAENILKTIGGEIKKHGKIAKKISSINIKLSTKRNSSKSHIAEMLMQGTVMGIIQIAKKQNKDGHLVDTNLNRLANKLLKTLQDNFESYKKCL